MSLRKELKIKKVKNLKQEHPARVVGDENWKAIAAYCDECPVLKKELGKEDIDYPVST